MNGEKERIMFGFRAEKFNSNLVPSYGELQEMLSKGLDETRYNELEGLSELDTQRAGKKLKVRQYVEFLLIQAAMGHYSITEEQAYRWVDLIKERW